MSIDLGADFGHPEAIAHQVRYARIDNTSTPSYSYVSPNPVNSPAVLATAIDNGQYVIEFTPIYADGRKCDPTIRYTPACPVIGSLSGYIQGGNLIVNYFADSEVPTVRITVNYPNGGSFSQNYVNNGNTITIPLPPNVYGDFELLGQSVCDAATGFYSAFSSSVIVSNNPAPSVTLTSNTSTGSGGTRTMIFQIGDAVAQNNRYVFTVYSHDVVVTAALGDTNYNIATKVAAAINGTTTTQWNDHASAPPTGTTSYPPSAIASSNQVTISLNDSNQFAANAYVT